MTKPKLALFFGAGAEFSYGLPSGGKFALDIFKMDTAVDKQKFRECRDSVNTRSIYAKNWLPAEYTSKPISSFGKTHYETLVRDSIENKRNRILDYLNNFDRNATFHVAVINEKGCDIKNSLERVTGTKFGSEVFTHDIKLSVLLGDNNNNIFSSTYFSMFLKILEIPAVDIGLKRKVQQVVRSLLELLIGSCGEDLIHKLNDGIFEKKPDRIDLFDDLGGIFSLDYKGTGLTGLDCILNSDSISLSSNSRDEDVISEFGMMILEDIFSQALDYQSLIDNNWRYLYNPKTDWAKFCKISIFLYTVRRYISRSAESNQTRCNAGPGYYHDIASAEELFEITVVGTTNYNRFIETATNKNVFFLNGSVNDFYDPYLNKIICEMGAHDSNHITVPFIFTQSGVKPLTSVKMSERYVELYNGLKNSDIICIIGYGFNGDDGHINGMFRSLIEEDHKQIYILHYFKDAININNDTALLKGLYQEKLRLESADGINIVIVNNDRKCIFNNIIWYEILE